MKYRPTVGEILQAKGVSRRGFLKYCATTASLLALPPSMIPRIA
ncbi:MAG: twin-arginine translocation signal domain-containing protein, partial [Woeseiaceae bacterium]|nr:twin-arginine translocation signal domain-containing protein [Woeseiaceae bacterium]